MRSLKSKHSEVKLPPKEAALLNLLCLHRNDVLTREIALKQIWQEETYFTARSMDVYIVKCASTWPQMPAPGSAMCMATGIACP